MLTARRIDLKGVHFISPSSFCALMENVQLTGDHCLMYHHLSWISCANVRAMIQIETDKQTKANILNAHNINETSQLQIIAKVFLSIFIKLYEKLLKCEQEFLLGFFS